MDRSETARRIETKRLAALGIRLADADHAGYANPDRSGNGFAGQDATRAPRCGPRHLHDQPSSADYGPIAVSLLGSARVSRAGEPVSGPRTFRTACKSSPRSESKEKYVSARRRNQHARPVRSPEFLSHG